MPPRDVERPDDDPLALGQPFQPLGSTATSVTPGSPSTSLGTNRRPSSATVATDHPFFESRKITQCLVGQWHEVNRKRVQRLMRAMGLEAIYPKPKLSAGRGHTVYPYLLRDVAIERANQVQSADITYQPLPSGFMYLAATIDWLSRYVVAWRLSNTLDGSFCQGILEEALGRGTPEVLNTDRGGYNSPPGRGPGGWSRPGWR